MLEDAYIGATVHAPQFDEAMQINISHAITEL